MSGIQSNKTRHAKKQENMTYGDKMIDPLKPTQNQYMCATANRTLKQL